MVQRAAVTERLDCSPLTKTNWVQFPTGSLLDIRIRDQSRRGKRGAERTLLIAVKYGPSAAIEEILGEIKRQPPCVISLRAPACVHAWLSLQRPFPLSMPVVRSPFGSSWQLPLSCSYEFETTCEPDSTILRIFDPQLCIHWLLLQLVYRFTSDQVARDSADLKRKTYEGPNFSWEEGGARKGNTPQTKCKENRSKNAPYRPNKAKEKRNGQLPLPSPPPPSKGGLLSPTEKLSHHIKSHAGAIAYVLDTLSLQTNTCMSFRRKRWFLDNCSMRTICTNSVMLLNKPAPRVGCVRLWELAVRLIGYCVLRKVRYWLAWWLASFRQTCRYATPRSQGRLQFSTYSSRSWGVPDVRFVIGWPGGLRAFVKHVSMQLLAAKVDYSSLHTRAEHGGYPLSDWLCEALGAGLQADWLLRGAEGSLLVSDAILLASVCGWSSRSKQLFHLRVLKFSVQFPRLENNLRGPFTATSIFSVVLLYFYFQDIPPPRANKAQPALQFEYVIGLHRGVGRPHDLAEHVAGDEVLLVVAEDRNLLRHSSRDTPGGRRLSGERHRVEGGSERREAESTGAEFTARNKIATRELGCRIAGDQHELLLQFPRERFFPHALSPIYSSATQSDEAKGSDDIKFRRHVLVFSNVISDIVSAASQLLLVASDMNCDWLVRYDATSLRVASRSMRCDELQPIIALTLATGAESVDERRTLVTLVAGDGTENINIFLVTDDKRQGNRRPLAGDNPSLYCENRGKKSVSGVSNRIASPMRVIEVIMEQRRNEGAGETGDPREDPLTNGIVRYDSHLQKSGDPARD
ncbi:hypothetical protein PR048_018675 [Dryococelus australis]|uniref:Uncharacterized protein n=1 Tax=Dryococelus australis TaxID=614101 RepID=A0ABQ9HD59_9NEOP|nr:hypothetical protein PR048_018675 [Dryococelus australis]